jgi:methionine--tRNA ligase beta chain
MTTNNDKIKYEDFAKLDIRVAEILTAEEVTGKDKLLKLTISLNEESPRTILAGIKQYYPINELKGKKIIVIANLEPRELAGIESNGMLLAASDNNDIILLTTDKNASPGSKIS